MDLEMQYSSIFLAVAIVASISFGCSDSPGSGGVGDQRDTFDVPTDTGAQGDVDVTRDTDDVEERDTEDTSQDTDEPECTDGSECDSGVCMEGECVAASCSDGVQNGDESDVDCGGTCEGCSFGDTCGGDADCNSGICGGTDGSTCTDCREGETQTTNTSCGYEERGVVRQVCNGGEWQSDGCVDVWFGSCAEIAEAQSSPSDGTYNIDPDGPSNSAFAPMDVQCDMTTDGGGWTRITPCTARQQLGGTLTGEEPAATADFDADCRPFTVEQDKHTYHYTFQFPAGFEEFFVEGYKIKNSTSSQNCIGEFTQTDWTIAHDDQCGDVSFGAPVATGPATSYGKFASARPAGNTVLDWPENETIFTLNQTATGFRVGWGEHSGSNPDDEGWFPWWQGSIWLR